MGIRYYGTGPSAVGGGATFAYSTFPMNCVCDAEADLSSSAGCDVGSVAWCISEKTLWGVDTAPNVWVKRNPAGAYGVPVVLSPTPSFATAYQASTPSKSAIVSIILNLTLSLTIGATANTVELIVGPTNAVASGTGTLADTYRNDLSVTLITLGFTGRQKVFANLPPTYYWALRRTVGTGITIISAFDQAVG